MNLFYHFLSLLFNLIFLTERMLFAVAIILLIGIKIQKLFDHQSQKTEFEIIACNQNDPHQDVVITGVCMQLIVQFRIK